MPLIEARHRCPQTRDTNTSHSHRRGCLLTCTHLGATAPLVGDSPQQPVSRGQVQGRWCQVPPSKRSEPATGIGGCPWSSRQWVTRGWDPEQGCSLEHLLDRGQSTGQNQKWGTLGGMDCKRLCLWAAEQGLPWPSAAPQLWLGPWCRAGGGASAMRGWGVG